MVELDLHHHTVEEALRAFVEFYNRHASGSGSPVLRIIHGYGSAGGGAKIQKRLRAFLQTASSSLDWKPGEDVDGNPGVTVIYPRTKLPAVQSRIEAEILSCCSVPRTESRIVGELRNFSPREIKEALRRLVGRGSLRTVVKGQAEAFVRKS